MKSDSAPNDQPEEGKRSGTVVLWLMVWLYLVIALLYIGVKWALLPNIDKFAGTIQSEISRLVGKPVQFESLNARIQGLTPVLTVSGLKMVDESGQSLVSLDRLYTEVSWLSLLTLEPRLARLSVSNPYVRVERKGQQWEVAGFPIDSQAQGAQEPDLLELLLRQGDVALSGGVIDVFQNGQSAGRIAGIGIDFKNPLGRHQLTATASQSDWFEKPLLLEADFSNPVWRTRLTDWTSWTGRFHAILAIKQLPDFLLPIKPELLSKWPAESAVELWAKLDQGIIPEATAQIDLKQMKLQQLGSSELPVAVPQASAWMVFNDINLGNQTGQVQVRNLKAALLPEGLDGIELGPVNANAQRKKVVDQFDWQVGLDGLDASRALAFSQQLAPVFLGPEWATLNEYTAQGQVSSMYLQWSSGQDGLLNLADKPFRGALSFKDLSFMHTNTSNGQQAGFENLSGEFAGDNASGIWSVSGAGSKLVLQELFDQKAIGLDTLVGRGRWANLFSQEGPVTLGVDNLELSNADLAGEFTGQYDFYPDGPDRIDLKGKLQRAKVAAAYNYLPKVIGQTARDWLAKNLREGSVSEGEFIAQGSVDQFPFHGKETEGTLLIKLPVQNAALTFAPDWPQISNIKGTVEILGKSLTVSAESGLTEQVRLKQVKATIANMDAWEPVLEIQGEGEGRLEDLVSYSNKSPVSYFIDNALAGAQVRGSSGLKLNLTIPIAKPEKTQVKGAVVLRENSVRLVQGMPWVHKLVGEVGFSNKGLSMPGLSGEALGNPVQIKGGNQPDGHLQINARGKASAAGLAGYLNPLIAPYLQGDAPFEVVVSSGKGGGVEIDVRSLLKGMEVKLPQPFSKPADEPMSFKLVRTGGNDRQKWEASLGPANQPLGYVIAGVNGGEAGGLEYLNASFGQPLPIERRGIQVRLGTEELDVDRWRVAIEDLLGQNEETRAFATGLVQDLMGEPEQVRKLPVRFELLANQLQVASKKFAGVKLVARSVENRWQFDINAEGTEGYFSWIKDERRPNGAVLGRFEILSIPESLDSETRSMVDDPVSSIPALDIEAKKFILGDLELGALKLFALNQTNAEREQAVKDNAPQEWRLEELRIENPESVTTANGIWQYGANLTNQRTDIQISQTVTNGGDLLDRLGNKGMFKGGQGTLEGRLVWNDAPSNIDYATLSGNFKLVSKKGQFLKVDPGVAKLLGVLSLQGITRRLSLDFNDLFAQGFAYDELTADVTLIDGKASTPNFKMTGPSATVLMDGTLDLAKETQDLNVVVLPDLNPTGGSLVYSVVAANPAVGIASLIADFLLKDPLSKIFSLQYKVTGPWAEPEIKQMNKAALSTSNPAANSP